VLELDHVLLAVDDLAAAGRGLEERHGLASVAGGRHPDWGTANRIVPLGSSYLELIAVDDEVAAAASAFGRWVAAAAGPVPRPLGWAVRVGDLDAHARRLQLHVWPGSRTRPDGSVVRWRLAGVDEAVASPLLPFFIEWGEGTKRPGDEAVDHPAGELAVARLELAGDGGRLDAWLGPHSLPLEVRPGPTGVTAVVLSAPAGETVLGGD
jgi:hypothetical protein